MPAFEITPPDLELLGFAAEHRIFLPDHVRALLGVSTEAADAQLSALTEAGLVVRRDVFVGEPPLYRITRAGLRAIDNSLEPPRIDPRCYEHDVGLAFLWLAARDGAFGAMSQVIGERRLRSSDARRSFGEAPLAVRLGGFGPGGQERLHYPDLLLVDRRGRRIALELELTGKGQRRIGRILDGYAADPRVDAVVYLVTKPGLGRSIAASSARAGIESRVYVQLVRMTVTAPGRDGGPVRGRVPARSATRVPARRSTRPEPEAAR